MTKPIQLSSHLVAYFWSRVQKSDGDGCWEWTGHRDRNGYGIIRTGDRLKAHRVAFVIAFGELGHFHALHHCDNPSCVRPDHLFKGTQTDNNRDRITKGRSRNGFTDATHCIRGHPFSGANLHLKHRDGSVRRHCRTCARDWAFSKTGKDVALRRENIQNRTTCRHGHPWNEENVRVEKTGRKICRKCDNARIRVRKSA